MSEFLVRDFTRARDVLTTRMLVTLALSVKTKDGSREQEILLVVLRRRQKVSLNQMKLAVALSCSYVNFIPHNFLSDMVPVDSVHGHASLL